MNAGRIGTDLGDFMAKVKGEPVSITGNSSGGLLAAWLAANRPEKVNAVLLEDPPLFCQRQSRASF
ncbi:MAG: alpha/beta hydrolase [Spirochaetales bacterium]|nr:alpha/beta hydrolase [Spirochaetales bacterium]